MRRIVPAALHQNTTTLDNNNHHKIQNRNHALNSTNSTPTRQAPHLRAPLQSRDQNVMMRVPPKSPLQTNSGNGNKMYNSDKQNNGTMRPLMPTLSAAAVKTSNRTPLTPRVAGSTPNSNSTPTPSARPRSDIRTPGGGPRDRERPRDDVSTPVSAFLNNNITPRSGSRKSRVDSTNSTPTGTPNGPQQSHDLSHLQESPYGSGLGIAGVGDKDGLKRPTVSFSPSLSETGSRGPAQSNSADSKFFFASDAKTIQAPRPQLQPSKNSFFYANGGAVPPPPQSSGSSAVGSTVGESQPKFFHANGTPDLQNVPHFPPPRPSSSLSTSSRMTSPRLQASPGNLSPAQRPPSPSKLNQQSSITPARPQSSVIPPRPAVAGRGQSANNIIATRRSSLEGQRIVSHGRSASVGSTDSKGPPVRKVSGGSSGDSLPPLSPRNIVPTSVPISTPEEANESNSVTSEVTSDLQSPTKAGHSLEHMNELAANARRERKVLDLEITNSSLAAINRTLEREMRKQTAELRRYRRLSRSGRLSIATTASMRTVSNGSTIDGIAGTQLSDMSEEDESEEEDSDYSEESLDDGNLSPSAMAESDLRHRKRDEKRLQLDLSKHQQLLIDSQKMNQSLKRCLGWTEDLINEGKKALAYSVRVSDVELGGRVLSPDEIEERNEGVNDPSAQLHEASTANETGIWAEDICDMDSEVGSILESQPQLPEIPMRPDEGLPQPPRPIPG